MCKKLTSNLCARVLQDIGHLIRYQIKLYVLTGIVLVLVCGLHAELYTVNHPDPNQSNNYLDLNEAILAALESAEDEVIVRIYGAAYELSQPISINLHGSQVDYLTIESAFGPETCSITAFPETGNGYYGRVFLITGNDTKRLDIRGITFTYWGTMNSIIWVGSRLGHFEFTGNVTHSFASVIRQSTNTYVLDRPLYKISNNTFVRHHDPSSASTLYTLDFNQGQKCDFEITGNQFINAIFPIRIQSLEQDSIIANNTFSSNSYNLTANDHYGISVSFFNEDNSSNENPPRSYLHFFANYLCNVSLSIHAVESTIEHNKFVSTTNDYPRIGLICLANSGYYPPGEMTATINNNQIYNYADTSTLTGGCIRLIATHEEHSNRINLIAKNNSFIESGIAVVIERNSAIPLMNSHRISTFSNNLVDCLANPLLHYFTLDADTVETSEIKNSFFVNGYPQDSVHFQIDQSTCGSGNPFIQINNEEHTYSITWDSSVMSPLIDTGEGGYDPDGSPVDIGAIRAIDHDYWQYRFRSDDIERNDTYHWVCYPVVNSLTQSKTIARSFFDELLGTHLVSPDIYEADLLQEIVWYEGNVPKLIYWNVFDWGQFVDDHHVLSYQGYKIKLLPVPNNVLHPTPVELHHSGFLTPGNTSFTIHGKTTEGQTYENWIGYFDINSSWPTDAFASIWNDITMIKAKDWVLYRDPRTGNSMLSGIMRPINQGEMVIVTTNNTHNFTWNTSIPTTPIIKPKPQEFDIKEFADYTPVFIDLSGVNYQDVKEIGLKLDGMIKGAVVVQDTLEQICVYLEEGESLDQGIVELVFTYHSKNLPQDRTTIQLNRDDLKKSIIAQDERYQVYNLKIAQNDLNVSESLDVILHPNYPNPFNPSTTISYTIELPGLTSIKIYNLKGQLVKTLHNGFVNPGTYSSVWNGCDENGNAVSSGVYLYQLCTNNLVSVRKMLLMK